MFAVLAVLLISAGHEGPVGQEAPAPRETAVVLHGLGRSSGCMAKLANTLESDFDVVNWDYPSRSKTLTELAEMLYGDVVSGLEAKGTRVHFVTHSMGGIVVRRMLKLHPMENLGRIVMIAPPNQGSAVARMVLRWPGVKWFFGPAAQELKGEAHLDETCAEPDGEIMVIAGTQGFDLKNPTSWVSRRCLEKPNDGTVSVNETKLPHMTEFLTVDESHTWIMRHRDVIRETKRFVTKGPQE